MTSALLFFVAVARLQRDLDSHSCSRLWLPTRGSQFQILFDAPLLLNLLHVFFFKRSIINFAIVSESCHDIMMKGVFPNAVRTKDTYRCIVFGSCICISCVIGRNMERVARKDVAL